MKEYNTLSDLATSRQSNTGLLLWCRENLLYYIVQAEGYVPTGDDVTFANGRVAKAVSIADAKYIKTVGGNVQDDLDSIISGSLPSQAGNEFKFLTTNGTSASWFQGTLQMDTFANLQTFSPTVDGTTFICQERANAKYILQSSGYVAKAGDVTFANGRVGALQVSYPVVAEWFGMPTDSDNDVVILANALSRLSVFGGEVLISEKYRVLSSLTVPPFASIKGTHDYLDATQRDSWSNLKGRIRLSSSATINLLNGSGISNCVLYRDDMTFSATGITAAEVALYAGTAITVKSASPYVSNNAILGFEWALVTDGANTPRGNVLDNKVDCTNGFDINFDLGGWNVTRCRCEPILTNSDADNIRSGTGFLLRNRSDWSWVTDCFTFQDVGYSIADASHIKYSGCGADHPTDGTDLYHTGIGFEISGDSIDNIFIGCQSASHLKGFRFNTDDSHRNYMIGCGMWNMNSAGIGIEVVGGDVSISSGFVRDFVGGLGRGLVVDDANSSVSLTSAPNFRNLSVAVSTTSYKEFIDDSTATIENVANARTGELVKQVASAGTLTLPNNEDVFEVAGATTIGTIVGAGVMPNKTVTLIIVDGLTINNGNNILNGAVNWTATAGSSITLQYITGNTWREVGRNEQ